jgi:hypothetical protein
VLVAEAPHSASTLQAIREENGSSNTAAIGAVMLFTYQLQFGQTVSSYYIGAGPSLWWTTVTGTSPSRTK